MKTDTAWRRLVIIITLGVALVVALLVVPAYPTVSEASAARALTRLELPGGDPVMAAAVNDSAAVLTWNQKAVELTLLPASGLAPVQQGRVMAIVQVAVHDAVNGITREYATYVPPAPAPADASPVAAAIAAAHHALRNLFTGHDAALDTLYADSLAAHGLSPDDPGIEYGRAAAAALLAARSNDHSALSESQFNYTAPGAGSPGVWVPLTSLPALLPGWGNVTPFVLRSASQFRPEPPPALDSETYAKDYNEIKQIGMAGSPTRTTEQTQIASFWLASPTAIWNPVLTQVLAARDLSLSATARAFALLYLAAADAGIACWEAKYTYDFWRPQPAIWSGDADGNDATAGQAGWTPLHPTPRHPEYPSGHSTNSSAIATVLASLFGDEPGAPITVQVGTPIGPVTRQWDSFSEGVEEVIDARVYSGIHFRNSDEVGARQGRQLAHFILTHALRPCGKSGSRCR